MLTSDQDDLPTTSIVKIDANLNSFEDAFPFEIYTKMEYSSIMLHFNNICRLQPSTFHLLPKLKRLNLSANKLDNDAVGILGNIPCCLEYLNLSSNANITSVTNLFSSPNSTISNSIKILDISFNFITDNGLLNLSNSKNLTELYLQGNNITNLQAIQTNISPIKSLRSLFLQKNDRDQNPVCKCIGYKATLLSELTQLEELDELGDRSAKKHNPLISSILDAKMPEENVNVDVKETNFRTEDLAESMVSSSPSMVKSARSKIPVKTPKVVKQNVKLKEKINYQNERNNLNQKHYDHSLKLSKQLEQSKVEKFRLQEQLVETDHTNKLLNNDIQNLQKEIKLIQTQSDKLKTALLASKKMLDNIISERDQLKQTVKESNYKFSKINQKTSNISKITTSLEKELLFEKSKNEKLTNEINDLTLKLQENSVKIDEIDHLKRSKQYLQKEHEMEIKNLKSSLLDSDNKDFQIACQKVLANAEERMRIKLNTLKEEKFRIKSAFENLEQEFNGALIIEDEKFNKLNKENEKLTQKLEMMNSEKLNLDNKFNNQNEKFKENLIILREFKVKLETIQKSSKEKDMIWQSRIDAIEKELTIQRKLASQIEPLKIEKSRLLSRITAHESVMEGLKQERSIWSKELSNKGFELSNERGRLEAKISSQGDEIGRLLKDLEDKTDIINIKSKLISDQTDTIKNLKNQIETSKEKIEIEQVEKLKKEIAKQNVRKEELKYENSKLTDQIQNFQHRWSEKELVLEKLEESVKKMKKRDQEKVNRLVEENKILEERLVKAENINVQCEERFRQQLCLNEDKNSRVLNELKTKYENELKISNDHVNRVENEMRSILGQQEKEKILFQERQRQISSAFKLLQEGLSS